MLRYKKGDEVLVPMVVIDVSEYSPWPEDVLGDEDYVWVALKDFVDDDCLVWETCFAIDPERIHELNSTE